MVKDYFAETCYTGAIRYFGLKSKMTGETAAASCNGSQSFQFYLYQCTVYYED